MTLVEKQAVVEALQRIMGNQSELRRIAYAHSIDDGDKTTVEINPAGEVGHIVWYVPEQHLDLREKIVPDDLLTVEEVQSDLVVDPNERKDITPTNAAKLGEQVVQGSDIIRDAVTELDGVTRQPKEFIVMSVLPMHGDPYKITCALITSIPP